MAGYDKEKLAKLVELEYERVAKFIDGVIATEATIRGWAVTIWLAVVGLAFSQSLWELGVVAAGVGATFFFIDAYHAWLYGEAIVLANELERLTASYYDSFGRLAGDNDAETDLRVALETHRFGLYRNLKRFRLRDVLFARPAVFFRFFYPALIAAGIGIAVLLGVSGGDDEPSCALISDASAVIVQCGNSLVVDEKVVRLP
jgi:hypothetical protein